MGKIYTSLKISGLFLLLTSTALASLWNYSSVESYEFPKSEQQFSSSWVDSPLGIFAVSFTGDRENPTVTAPDDLKTSTDPGICEATISIPEITYTGNDLTWSMSGATTASGSGHIGSHIFNKGITTVTFTAHGDNSTAQDSMQINVNDEEDPKLTLGNLISENTDAGQCTASIAIPNATFSDNCTESTLSWSMSGDTSGSGTGQVGTRTFNLGTTTINYTVTDAAGNTTPGTLNVEVTDKEDPKLTLGNPISENTDAGQCTASIAIPHATFSDNCTESTLSWSMSGDTSGSGTGQVGTRTFNLGTTTINYTVTDAAGNITTNSLDITVTDNENPVVTAGTNITVSNGVGQCYAEVSGVEATVTDNCSVGDPVGVRSDGEAINASYPVGVTTIEWTVTDENGNSATPVIQTVTVEDKEAPIAPDLEDITWGCSYTVEIPTAPDNCSGTVTATANRSTTFDTPGTHSITWTFTDEAANSSTATQNITISPVEVSMSRKVDILCNGEDTGEITVNATGGVGPYTYSWNSLENGAAKTNLTAGTYIVTATDDNGCESEPLQIILTEPDPLIMSTPTITNLSCKGADDGIFVAGNISGGVPGYQYMVTGRAFQTSGTFENLAAGNYTLTVRDQNSCILEEDFEITEPDELSMTEPSFTEVSCFGGSDGTITAGNITGGTAPYEFSIENVNFTSSSTFENVSAGNHTIFVTDANGCALQVPVTVTQPAELKATLSKKNVSCHEGDSGEIIISAPVGGHGSYQYSIDGTNWQSDTTFKKLTAGTYEVSMRDAVNPDCVVVLNSTFILEQPDAPISVKAINTTRTASYGTATGSATVDFTGGTPGYTYEWRKAGETEILQTTKTATNLAAGFYEVTAIDSQGCTLVQEVEIIDAILAYILTRSTCEIEGDIDAIRTFHYIVEDETALGGVAPYTYSWDFGEGAEDPERSGIGEFWVDYNTTGNKTITLTVTDFTGATFTTTQEQYIGKCYNPCGRSSNIDFDPNNIYIGYSDGTPMDKTSLDYCNPTVPKYIFLGVDKSANIYNPYIELSFIISNTIVDVSNNYFADGCREKEDIDENLAVNQDNRVGDFIKLTKTPIEFNCGDNLNIDSFYITWTNVSKKECGANNNKFCWSTNEPLHVPTELRAEATSTHILCKEDSTGTITVKASGGFAPYSYTLAENDTPPSGNQFFGLPAGDYTIYVQDSAGEETSATVTITEPETAVSATVQPTNPLCFGETGTATVIIDDHEIGTPFPLGELENDAKYKYLWNDPDEQTTATAHNLAAGDYTVTVIDANGCQTIATVTITQPDELTTAETGEPQTFGCGFTYATLSGNLPETGIGSWEIISGAEGTIVDPSDPASMFTGIPGQTYILEWSITDENGNCGTSSELVIEFAPECSMLDFDGVNDYIIFGDHYDFPATDFTLEAWVKPESVQGIRTVLSKRNSRNPGVGGYDLIINNGAPTFRWNNKSVSTSSKVGTDRWYHLAVIFSGSTVELYVDGIRVGNSTGAKPSANDHPFLVGALYDQQNPDVPVNHFEGWIEEVRLWNTALSVEQVRFMMNQRIEDNAGNVKGEILPMDVPGPLDWSSLSGYYRLLAQEEEIVGGITEDRATNKVEGNLKNIETFQENSAPLPYISDVDDTEDGNWRSKTTWLRPTSWDPPNSKGITGASIDWNIASVAHILHSDNQDITLLGFLLDGELDMLGTNQVRTTVGTGNGLTVTTYLELNGFIDLNGESQLIQTEGSLLEGAGHLEKDQQGTGSSYNYNYWTSPVSTKGNPQNSGYTIGGVMQDGTDPDNPKTINFNGQYHWADGSLASPIRLSTFWLHKFFGRANQYSEWVRVGTDGKLESGEGFSMKGSSGHLDIQDLQNYTFTGMPNNGNITLSISTDQNYLIGNPYPSAIDASEFIKDNLGGRRNGQNIFNGSVYFWSHFSGKTHYLERYIGGYAVYNLSGGIKAIANDERINATTDEGGERPQQYIPVGQAFFVNTVLDESISSSEIPTIIHGGEILFKNSQRIFAREKTDPSVFHSQEPRVKGPKASKETRQRFWLEFTSPEGYRRQLLVTRDENATTDFDLGFDAPLIEDNLEDMYWMINGSTFVIQGVPDFNVERQLPFGLKLNSGEEFTISIDELENIPADMKILVKDKINDTYHDLRASDFQTTAEKGAINERYAIVFSEEIPSGPEDGGEEDGDDGNNNPGEGEGEGEKEQPEPDPDGIIELAYSNSYRTLSIKNPALKTIDKAVLYNGLGQELKVYPSIPVEIIHELPVTVRAQGMYIFKIFYTDGTKSLRFIVE